MLKWYIKIFTFNSFKAIEHKWTVALKLIHKI